MLRLLFYKGSSRDKKPLLQVDAAAVPRVGETVEFDCETYLVSRISWLFGTAEHWLPATLPSDPWAEVQLSPVVGYVYVLLTDVKQEG